MDARVDSGWQTNCFYRGLGGNYDIYTLSVDGRGLRRITLHLEFDGSPAWSPDGHTIVFMSLWAGNYDIYRVNVNGAVENRRKLTRHREVDMGPAWVPTGALLVSPTTETQTTLWGRLKQSVGD